VVGVRLPYDRRHAAAVSPAFDRPDANTPYSLGTHGNPQRHTVTLASHTHTRTTSLRTLLRDSQRRRARSASLRTHGDSQSHTVTLATHTHARSRTHAYLGH
jgi:hypothetical protein